MRANATAVGASPYDCSISTFSLPKPPQLAGVPRANAFIRQYAVYYSYDCSSYTQYTENGVERRFRGNWDTTTVVRNYHAPVWARCYRVYLRNWDGVQPGMRLELFAYPENLPSTLGGARHSGYLGSLFRDGCPTNQFLMRQASGTAATVLPAAVAYDMSGTVPTGSRGSSWPKLYVAGEQTLTFSSAGTRSYSFTAYANIVATDTCTSTVTVVDGARTLNSAACPAGDTVLATEGRLDGVYAWTLPSGYAATVSPGTRFRLGRTKVFVYSSSEYCSFEVRVVLGEFWRVGGCLVCAGETKKQRQNVQICREEGANAVSNPITRFENQKRRKK